MCKLILLGPYTRKRIFEHEFETLQPAPCPVCPVNYPTRFDRDAPTFRWEGERDGDSHSDFIDSNESEDVEFSNKKRAGAEAPHAHTDASKAQAGIITDWAENTCKFLVYIGFP